MCWHNGIPASQSKRVSEGAQNGFGFLLGIQTWFLHFFVSAGSLQAGEKFKKEAVSAAQNRCASECGLSNYAPHHHAPMSQLSLPSCRYSLVQVVDYFANAETDKSGWHA